MLTGIIVIEPPGFTHEQHKSMPIVIKSTK